MLFMSVFISKEGLACLVCSTCIKDNFVRERAFNKYLKLHNEKVLEIIIKIRLKSLWELLRVLFFYM